jgi:hypothetical protein
VSGQSAALPPASCFWLTLQPGKWKRELVPHSGRRIQKVIFLVTAVKKIKSNNNRKFLEELVANFPLLLHVPHRKQKNYGEYRDTDAQTGKIIS